MLKWIILIIVVVALYSHFRTEESRKNLLQIQINTAFIAENKTAAYEKIDQLTKDGNIVKTNPGILVIFVDENW